MELPEQAGSRAQLALGLPGNDAGAVGSNFPLQVRQDVTPELIDAQILRHPVPAAPFAVRQQRRDPL
jgi:hypothetical protein